jgi:3-hydroxyisobutyrate dehydrogenase-like beta-hydroxyacid dehydrogenase
MSNVLTLALIGYGEVGQTFARALVARDNVRVAAYDILFDDPMVGATRIAAARAAGVAVASDAAAASGGAGIVISAVTAAEAATVAGQAAGYLQRGQIFFDINSASPATKKRSAALVEAAGARFVEGAVMAPVAGPGIRVPILAGGPAAAAAAEILTGLGMNVMAVTTEPGRASAMKLCRSIMIKGMEALIIDCAAAAQAWDVEREVFGSLHETFPSIDWPKLAVTMAERVRKHGIRRAAEMREAAQMLDDLSHDPALCRAVADRHEHFAKQEKAKAAKI